MHQRRLFSPAPMFALLLLVMLSPRFGAAAQKEEAEAPEEEAGDWPRLGGAPVREDSFGEGAAFLGAKAQVRFELVAATEKTAFAAAMGGGALALDEPHYFKHRATIPFPRGGGAEVLLVSRLLLSRNGTTLDADIQAFAEVVDVFPGEGAASGLRGRRIVRRERLSLPAHSSRILELTFPPPPPAPFRLHLVLTRETPDEAAAFVESLGAAPVVSTLWRMKLRALRHRPNARPDEEALELWARSGEDAVYRYEREKASGGVEEFFELRLAPSEEDGAAVLETRAEGRLLRAPPRDGAIVMNRRDMHLAASRSSVSLKYLDTEGEGFTFDVLLERVPVAPARY